MDEYKTSFSHASAKAFLVVALLKNDTVAVLSETTTTCFSESNAAQTNTAKQAVINSKKLTFLVIFFRRRWNWKPV